jgi:hypothetical protein
MNPTVELDESIESMDESMDLINTGHEMMFCQRKSRFFLINL